MKRLLPLLVLLAACGHPPAPPLALPGTAPNAYRQGENVDKNVYAVDPQASLLTVTVRRAGPLARLGHDHVVASRVLEGHVLPGAGSAALSFRLDRMSVDEPQLLRDAGITRQPSAEAVAGTRTNMLGPVLDAQRYPVVRLHAQRRADGRFDVDITLHGVTRRLVLPVAVELGAGQIDAQGAARLKQTDFGITPFSVGGGLLSVRDEIEVHYRIVARPPREPARSRAAR